MNKDVLFSSKSDEWTTPKEFFNELNKEFNFNLDPCADNDNHLTQDYYTKEQDGLQQDWSGKTVFCNPPYSDISRWVRKCHDEGVKDNTTVVLLVPARTDTKYFHNFIENRAEIRFIKGRLKFGDGKNSAPFPSLIVIFRGAFVNK